MAQDQAAARSNAAQARMGKHRKPTVPLTTESLNTVQAEAAEPSRIRVVILPAVVKNSKILELSSLGVFDNTVRDDVLFTGMLLS
jgi:hypothetical protein